jgi:hypothetical protein
MPIGLLLRQVRWQVATAKLLSLSKTNARLIDDRRSTQADRFATDDGAASKETVGLGDGPPRRPPPYVSTHRAAQRASMWDRSVLRKGADQQAQEVSGTAG